MYFVVVVGERQVGVVCVCVWGGVALSEKKKSAGARMKSDKIFFLLF